jgi:hypothetical protein
MPESFIQVPPNSSGLKMRTRQRTVGANTVEEQYVIPIGERVVSFEGAIGTFRVPGSAATPQNLLSVENTAGSAVLLGIRRIAVDVQVSATTAAMINTYIRLFRGTTVPTGGTTHTKHSFDSTESSAANVVVRGPASADGTATAITYALPSGNPMREQALPGIMTGVGQWLTDDLDMWKYDYPPLILRAGESILVAATAVAIPAHIHLTTKIIWEEFTLP